ncbi:unnamed protein product, partial [marine sediment metagenome]
MIGKTLDYLHITSAKITLTQDAVLKPINLTPGLDHSLLVVQDGTGGHAVYFANVEWDAGRPSFTTTASAATLIDFRI